MNAPSRKDIKIAFEHGKWLRGETLGSESRMLADLSWEIERLRAALKQLADAEDASIDEFGAKEISAIEQAMARARDVLGEMEG